jgi:hypothetical protein
MYTQEARAEAEAAQRMIDALAARGELDDRHPAVVMARDAIRRWERIKSDAESYPGRRLFVDTDGGIIQVGGPTEGRPLRPIGYEAYYEYAGFKYQVKKTEDGWIATAHPGQHRAATKIKHLQAAVQCYLREFKEA